MNNAKNTVNANDVVFWCIRNDLAGYEGDVLTFQTSTDKGGRSYWIEFNKKPALCAKLVKYLKKYAADKEIPLKKFLDNIT